MRIKSFTLFALSMGLGLLAIEITFAQTSQASTPRTKVTELVTRSSSNYGTVGSTDSISPANVVLVLDANTAQAYDPGSMLAWLNNNPDIVVSGMVDPNTLACDPRSFADLGGTGPYGNYSNANYYQNACVKACNDNGTCYPFKTVKDAAKAFIDQLRPGYDRIAIVSIDRQPQLIWSLSTDVTGAKAAIDGMRVSDHIPGDNAGEPCSYITVLGERWKCAVSNIGGAIRLASEQLAASSARRVTVLFTTGAPDTSDPFPSVFQSDAILYGVCPGRDTLPFCRDTRWATHHVSNTAQYDAEDYAYDQANYLGVSSSSSYTQFLNLPNGGLGAQIYTLGLGKKIVCTSIVDLYDPGPPVQCVPAVGNQYVDPDTIIPPIRPRGYSNGAESFLRYVAAVGDDGDPTTNPCAGAPLGAQCGNYYFASNATIAQSDLLTIANLIFTPTLPLANFSAEPLSGVMPLVVTFTNQSIGSYTESLWDFGDGLTGTLQDPTHTYATSGVFTVSLTVTGPSQTNAFTHTNYITVYQPVLANFTATPLTGVLPLTVTFTNLSTGPYVNSLWDFGDGITSTAQNPSHIYTTPGVFTVTLIASGVGQSDSLTQSNYITVYQPVLANFIATPLTGLVPLVVTFTNQSTGPYVNSLWDFGDGLTGTVQNPTHTYTLSGTYTISLTVSSTGQNNTFIRADYVIVTPHRIYLPLMTKN